MNIDDEIKKAENKLIYLKMKKIIHQEHMQPERLSEKTLYRNDEEIRLEEIHFPSE